jgi:Arc/MetJ-type ribon-helix-helix transcriptional regulator
MSHSLTVSQKRLVKDLLRIGRWNNESEIIRYGLHLVAKEVQAEQTLSLAPYGRGVLARAYKKISPEEREAETAMAQRSAKPAPGELE